MRKEILNLFPVEIAGTEVTDFSNLSPLKPEEQKSVARAVPKRVLEFTAGRHCARAALTQLGLSPVALPPLPSRAPNWPPGVSGSISHCEGYCGAVVAFSNRLRGIGFDVEGLGSVRPEVWPLITTQEELRTLQTLPTERANQLATLFYSAKEAFYKAQHPLTETFLDFKDVRVEVTNRDRFVVKLNRNVCSLGTKGAHFSGSYYLGKHRIFTGVSLPPIRIPAPELGGSER